ncbi:MAG TPA: hypothetical protein VD766_05295 [Solirubrobacterales bacterium]|nr:hypothetical protein [Solirubrobacterales bacterium]
MGYLSDVARRRIAAVVLVVVVVIAILAITDSAFFEDPPTQEEKVADTVKEFFAAAAEGDFQRDCELLSDEAQRTARTSGARAIGDGTKPSCADSLESVMGDSFASITVRVRSVNISGSRARAEAALKPEGEPSTFRTILLETGEDGGWLISDFG